MKEFHDSEPWARDPDDDLPGLDVRLYDARYEAQCRLDRAQELHWRLSSQPTKKPLSPHERRKLRRKKA